MTDVSHSRWRTFWDRILPSRHGEGCNTVLLLRVENLMLLANRLGQAGLSQLLTQVLMRLGGGIRQQDAIRIVGQGQFCITISDRSEAEAMRIALRLQDQGQQPVGVAGHQAHPVLTGVLIRDGEAASEDMIQCAHQRLSMLPADRFGRISLFDLYPAAPDSHLPATVAQAASEGQITALFQPQICCDSGRVTGFEALARWDHPTRGLLNPAAFMPGMTPADHGALSLCILRQSLTALKRWDQAGYSVPTVSLNISNCELSDPDFASAILWELDRQDLLPSRLVLEVLETVGPINCSDQARRNLARLSQSGCHLDLDDFGTGYASLDAIRQFGVHRIKIDRSFVTACDHDPAQQRMELAILALADRLGIATLAEGVETKEEHSFLAQIGCDQVQGFAIARPMPFSDTLGFLENHERHIGPILPLARKGTG